MLFSVSWKKDERAYAVCKKLVSMLIYDPENGKKVLFKIKNIQKKYFFGSNLLTTRLKFEYLTYKL